MQQRLLMQIVAGLLIVAAGLLVGGVALAQEGSSGGLLDGLSGGLLADDDEDDDEFEFSGKVERLPDSGLVGEWTVGTRTVHVTTSTEIDQDGGSIGLGTVVEVEGQPQADGSILATEIERDDGGDDDDDDEDD